MIYINFIIMILIFKEIEKKYLSKKLIVTFTLIFLFSALRYDVGWDYKMYYEFYKGDLSINNMDFLFQKIIDIARYFNTPQLLFGIYSFITVLFVYLGICNDKNNTLGIVTFLMMPFFYLTSFSTIRQLAAVAVSYYGIKKYENKIFKLIGYLILAYLLHFSALISWMIIFIIKFLKNKSKKKIIKINTLLILLEFILFSFSNYMLIMLHFVIKFFSAKYIYKLDYYLSINQKSGGEKIIILMYILSILLFIFILRNKKLEEKLYINITIFNTGIFIWIGLFKFSDLGYRLSIYFLIFLIDIIMAIPLYIKNKLVFKLLLNFIGILLFLGYILNTHLGYLNGINRKSQFIPYKIFINKNYTDLR